MNHANLQNHEHLSPCGYGLVRILVSLEKYEKHETQISEVSPNYFFRRGGKRYCIS